MAETLQPSTKSKSPGVKKGKKLSTRVDLTPMVDLGFLLITFFIFTTTLSSPNVMKLAMPKDSEIENLPIPFSGALTILLGKDDSLNYYFRDDPSKSISSDYKNIRQVILDKKRITEADKFFVIIQPNRDATYKNVVDLLDEMAINDVQHYAMVDQPDQ